MLPQGPNKVQVPSTTSTDFSKSWIKDLPFHHAYTGFTFFSNLISGSYLSDSFRYSSLLQSLCISVASFFANSGMWHTVQLMVRVCLLRLSSLWGLSP